MFASYNNGKTYYYYYYYAAVIFCVLNRSPSRTPVFPSSRSCRLDDRQYQHRKFTAYICDTVFQTYFRHALCSTFFALLRFHPPPPVVFPMNPQQT